MTLRQLEIFLAIARHGQVTKAAQAVNLTQSATSMALAQLETLLDVELFHRDGRRLLPTERGRLLMAEAPALLERARALPSLLHGREGPLRGELNVAASSTVGRYLLAPAIAAFARRHPAVNVQLSIGNAESAAAALIGHGADLAYVEGSVAHPMLTATPWREDQMVIVTSVKNWRGKSRRLSRSRLSQLEWVMREPGSGTREILEHALKAMSLPPPRETLRFHDSEAILQTLISGIGVACLSRLVANEAVRTKRVVVLEAPYLALSRTLWRVTHRDAHPGPVQDAFSQFVLGER